MFIIKRTETISKRVNGLKHATRKTSRWGLGYANREDAEDKVKEFQDMPEHAKVKFDIEEK